MSQTLKLHTDAIEFFNANDGTLEEVESAYGALIREVVAIENNGTPEEVDAAFDMMAALLEASPVQVLTFG